MSTITKFIAGIVLAAPLLLANQAFAATYKLPIDGGSAILKIFLDNGVARRASANSDVVTFDVEMNGNECIAFLRIAFANNASPLHLQYDVCSEKGFGLTMTRIRF